jgi:N-acetylneuraminate synthase/sialic acid synthase
MRLAETVVTDDGPTYVIAEIGHNHQGSVDTARKLFAAAKTAGANAVKLQKRDNRSLFTREFFERPYENENSFGDVYGTHREALEFGAGEYRELQAYAAELEIDFFATAFDQPSVDFLEDLDMPAYKVASGDITNLPLLRYLAETGKPLILSTGGALRADVIRAYEVATQGDGDVAVLQCTAGYPAAWEELNLRVIETYRDLFPGSVIGLSSHDNGIAMAVAAHVLGGRIVEKHFTLDRSMRGTDHSFSLEPVGLTKMVRDLRRLHVALGDGQKRVYESERAPITKMSKALVAAGPLEAGHLIGPEDIAIKSPGDGMPPSDFERLVGARLVHSLKEDQAFSLEAIADALSNGALTSNGSASSLSAAQRAE